MLLPRSFLHFGPTTTLPTMMILCSHLIQREESVQKDQEKIEKSENRSAVAVFWAGRAPKGSREESQTNTC
ncbi:hypothetical protein AMECASPLE_013088 [Ameca splendens]|uniref:Secreted protein n=1 Tax=Ameca splendens TaxID=208324 RepID=A0ABV0XEC3_9TELE